MNYEPMKTFLEENSMMQAAIAQIGDVVPWVAYPGDSALEAQQLVGEMRNTILQGEGDVAQTMQETQDKINDLF